MKGSSDDSKDEQERERRIPEDCSPTKKESIIRKLTDTITESKEMESNVAQDLVDKAETSYTKEFLLSLSDGEREQLLLIDEALKRLEHGEFGVCQICQKEIGGEEARSHPLDALLHRLPGEGRGRAQGPVTLSFRAGGGRPGPARRASRLSRPSVTSAGLPSKEPGKGSSADACLAKLVPRSRSVVLPVRTVLRGRGRGPSLRALPGASPGFLAPPVLRRLRRHAQGRHPALQVPEVRPAQPPPGPLCRRVPGGGRAALGGCRFPRPRPAPSGATEGTGASIRPGSWPGTWAGLRDLDVLGGCLVKVRNVPPQAGLRAADRERNVVRAYAVKRPAEVAGEDAHPRRRCHHDRSDHPRMRPSPRRSGGERSQGDHVGAGLKEISQRLTSWASRPAPERASGS